MIDIYDRSQDVRIKEHIIDILEDFEYPSAFQKLKDIALNEKHLDLCLEAIYNLSDMEHPESMSILKDLIKNSKDIQVKTSAVFALEDQDPKEASKILLDMALTSSEKELAETAVYVLEDVLEESQLVRVLQQIYNKSPFIGFITIIRTLG